ncbi:MAG: RNA polymerase factor sigma-32 [Salaquimonas sp.]|nr:RNA polymerase factor sigma-32 [Salaquimonas sp.]
MKRGTIMSSNGNADNRMIKAAVTAPYLERDEEHDLAVRWAQNQDQEALHRLTSAHMRLVIAIAAKFRRYGLMMNDLIQEGHIGLLEAAVRFDPERGVRFSTYATWWIRASIQDYILRNWSIVRGGTSSTQKSLFFSLRRLRAQILKDSQPANSHELYKELAQAIGVSVNDVARMDSRLSGPDASLNAPIVQDNDTTSERQDYLVDENPLPDETVETVIDGEKRLADLANAMDVLNPRERRIIQSRRLNEVGATLEQLGDELGISKERVRQIESRALEKLKKALVATGDFPSKPS